ncbi:hypothetical protein PTRA_a1844 [Pseudoalteromonas translucida KMM 520]|uniref:DUF4435 domain-containing protein n=1 Tax=Pseudoalteromonas translucida KMM 520 TaxID=1315283 RepID=A0A0U2VHQ1_9GAMM|nr:DUF4435 domain-containing protein [Pseudoalteromonas translucida]ALS32997.1 hypothetical protein PTRA_a1844 [Pseudoalteromonas translucida KMM 520]
MSRVDVLKKSRDSISVKFLEFTRIVSKGANKVAVFFEGEDEKYFSVRINNIRPDIQWSGVNSKGKSNVIKLRNKIRKHSTYQNASCLFFVDSDFDCNSDINGFNDIYITPCYSIENLFLSSATFERVMTAEFGLSDVSEEHKCYQRALEVYDTTKESYLQVIKEFNYLIRELRNMEKNGALSSRLNINNLNISDLISVNLGSVSKEYDESKPITLFPELPENLQVSLQSSVEHFNDLCFEQWFRGKQHLEFLRVFLGRIKEDRCKKKDRTIFHAKVNVKLSLTKANCISELSQYADTPTCLKEFLERQILDKSVA